jgi:hypothetical protein
MEKFTLCKLFGYLCNQCEFVSECDHGEIYMGFLYTMLLIINSRKKVSTYKLYILMESQLNHSFSLLLLKRHIFFALKMGLIETIQKNWKGCIEKPAKYFILTKKGIVFINFSMKIFHRSKETKNINSLS